MRAASLSLLLLLLAPLWRAGARAEVVSALLLPRELRYQRPAVGPLPRLSRIQCAAACLLSPNCTGVRQTGSGCSLFEAAPAQGVGPRGLLLRPPRLCPTEWVEGPRGCFIKSASSVRADLADVECRQLDARARVVFIGDQAEQDFIIAAVPVDVDVVIGLQRTSADRPWFWVTGQAVSFLPFKDDEPREEEDRLFVFMEKTGGWKTKKPSDKARVVCHIPF